MQNHHILYFVIDENLALKSIATQISQNATYPGSLAVDGNRTKSSCSKTEGSHALLQIDLLQLSIVTTIYINFEGTIEHAAT